MKMRFIACVASVVVACGLLALAQEPAKSKQNPRIMTGTRQVMTFTNLETQLLTAVQKKDKAALQAMISDDFVIEMPNTNQLGGDEWLDSVMSPSFTLTKFGVHQVAITDLGNAVIVKFERLQDAQNKDAKSKAATNNVSLTGEFFVIDLWKKEGDAWKLATRYVSKISSTVPAEKAGDMTPTGKQ